VLRVFHDSSGIRCSVRRSLSHCSDGLRVSGRLVSGSREAFVKVGEDRGPCGIVGGRDSSSGKPACVRRSCVPATIETMSADEVLRLNISSPTESVGPPLMN